MCKNAERERETERMTENVYMTMSTMSTVKVSIILRYFECMICVELKRDI